MGGKNNFHSILLYIEYIKISLNNSPQYKVLGITTEFVGFILRVGLNFDILILVYCLTNSMSALL